MFKRILTGVMLIGLVVGSFLLRLIDTRLFFILIYLCSVVGTFEMLKALDYRLSFFQRSRVIAFSICFLPAYVFLGFKASILIAFTVGVLCLLTLVFEFDKVEIDSVGYTFLACFYPNLMLLPIILMNNFETHSLLALLLTFIVAPCADTFAYFIGSFFKGRKLSPNISPKKTISGAIGGIIGGVIGAVLVWACYSKGHLTEVWYIELLIYVIIGVIGSLVSIVGDLIEGAIKRKLTIKDMGSILPGHGGVLDRIDGIMLSAMFIFIFFMFIR